MIERFAKLALALAAPLLLFGCLLTPGRFVSTLTVNADRSFAFTYKGEVIAVDPSAVMKGLGDKPPADPEKPTALRIADPVMPPDTSDADSEAKNREVAAALSKEYGYRSVTYQGKGKFLIDYAISGTLTHNFVFPFNSDAEVVLPFVMIELRQGGVVRVKAPGFATNANSAPGGLGSMGGSDEAAKLLDGVFTLDTDAEIVSQNNEAGARASGKRHAISWKATPLTKDAPSAVLKLAH